MANHASTLSVQVRTGDSVAQLNQLREALDRVQQAASNLVGQVDKTGARATSSTNKISSALKVAAAEVDSSAKKIEKSIERAARQSQQLGYRVGQNIGKGVFASTRLALDSSVKDLEEFHKKVSATEIARSQFRIAEAQKWNKALLAAETEDRKKFLAALKADILERSRLEANYQNIRAADARRANSLILRNESQARKQELQQLRDYIIARHETEERGIKRREATRRKQLALNDAYFRKDLAGRVRHLQQVRRIMEMEAALPASLRRSTSTLARQFGVRVLGQLGNLPNMEAELASISQGHKKITSSAHNSTAAIRGNTAAMRDAHGMARGLSGALGSLWMTYGSIAPLLAGAAIGTMARSTFQVGKDLEYRLRFVEALGNRPISVDEMMPQVIGSMKTPLEAAEALQALAQAGFTANESLQTLGTTMRLSTLGELDITEAARTMTGTISAFGLSASQAERVGDVFAKAAASSNTSVAQITEAMRQASTAAAQYNISIEEASAALAVMAKRNIVGSMAGTSYRNMLKELYTPIARGAQAMEQLGLSAYKADGSMKPLSEVLLEVRDRLVGLDEQSRNVALEAIFGERGGRAIRPILADLEGYLEMIERMEDSTGFLAEANAKLIDTVEGSANRFQSTLQQSYAKAYEEVEGNVRDLILTLDRAVASEGFINVLKTLVNSITAIGEAAVRSAGFLKTIAIVYGTIKVAQVAAAGVQALLNAYKQAGTVASNLKAAALNRETAALKANTAAQAENSVAERVNAAAKSASTVAETASRTTTVGGALLTLMGRLTPVLGAVTLGYIAVNAVLESYNRKSDQAGHAVDKLIARNRAHAETLKQLADEAEESYKRMRAETLGLEPHDSHVERYSKAGVQELAALEQEMLPIRQQLNQLGNQLVQQVSRRAELEREVAAREKGWMVANTELISLKAEIYSTTNKINHLLGEMAPLQERIRDAVKATNDEERERIRLLEAQKKIESMQRGSALTRDLDYAREQQKQLRAKVDAGTISDQESLLLAELDKSLGKQGEAVVGIKTYIDWNIENKGELDEAVEHSIRVASEKLLEGPRKLQESFSLSKSRSGSGGSREFISNASLIKQRYDQEKSMYASVRDMQLKGITELEKVGSITVEAAAEQRRRVWDEYISQTISSAEVAAGKIRAVDKGSDYLKELTATRVLEDAHHQRELHKIDEQRRAYEEMIKVRVEAQKSRLNLAGTLGKLEEKLAQEEKKRAFENAKQYLTDVEIAGIEARERAERQYNSVIAQQVEAWEKLVALKAGDRSAAEATEEGQAILYVLRELREAQHEAGLAAMYHTEQIERQNQTVLAGLRRATTHYKNEALKTGDIVEESFKRTFDSMSAALSDFVATGKADFRSLTVSVLENLARMAMQASLNPLFGMLLKVGQGLLSGAGSSPASQVRVNGPVYTGGDLSIMGSAKGNAFSGGQLVKFAKGGTFTNRVTSGTNIAPMAMFGERGPEAIVPLARSSDGTLGVRAFPIGAQQGGGGNNFFVETNVVVNQDGSVTSSSAQSNDANAQRFGAELQNAVLQVITRETTSQGGIINRAIRSAT